MIPIFVPSMGRAKNFAARDQFNTVFRFSSPAMRANTVVIVPPAELGEYRRALGDRCSGVVPCVERGIASTRRVIGEYCRNRGHEKFLMLDDDCWFFTRVSDQDTRLRQSAPEDVDAMLAAVESQLDYHAHVGISAREGNNRLGVGGPQLVVKNTRTLRALAYRTDEFLSCEHGRVEVQEDFDVNLQLLEKGLPNANLAYWAQDQRMTNAPGGCSTYRTHKVQDRAARRLAELHPGVVRLVQKENKTDAGAFGTRTDVVISWKKAFESGVSARAARG